MKRFTAILSVLIIVVFSVFALASGEDTVEESVGSAEGTQAETKPESATVPEENTNALGDYSVVIDSCRLAKDYEGKDVVIVKYIFNNVSNEEASAFCASVTANVYQDGIGLNESIFLDDSAEYSADNQTKAIKEGTFLEVEVAYELNDTTTDIDVEVTEWVSFDDKMVTKTFSIA